MPEVSLSNGDSPYRLDISAFGIGSPVLNEVLFGTPEPDDIKGAIGDDEIFGLMGADSISSGSGNDSITGGEGNDTISGGAGNDTLTLGAGDDTAALSRYGGDDVITDFDIGDTDSDGFTNDQLDVSSLRALGGDPVNVADVVVSDDGTGNAVLTFPNGESVTLTGITPAAVSTPAALVAMGIPSDEIVEGTAGADLIDTAYTGDPDGDMIDAADNSAGNDDDIVVAGAGNDTILSGDGNDSVDAGDGDDIIRGGSGDDTLAGGEGSDSFIISDLEFGNDTIDGGSTGSNVDTIQFQPSSTPFTVTFTGDKSGTISDGTSISPSSGRPNVPPGIGIVTQPFGRSSTFVRLSIRARRWISTWLLSHAA